MYDIIEKYDNLLYSSIFINSEHTISYIIIRFETIIITIITYTIIKKNTNLLNLCIAIKSGNEHKLRELLTNFKEFIDSRDPSGNTLLIIAVINVQVNIVKMLIDEGADVNAPDSRGMTSLHYAGMFSYRLKPCVFKFLISPLFSSGGK